MSGDQLNLDLIDELATENSGGPMMVLPETLLALVAEVRRLRALVVVDDDSHPAFQPPSDHAGYFVESP